MKIRQGFVSNSSSSSFIITIPTGKKLDENIILPAFGVPKNSPLYPLALAMAQKLVYNSKKISSSQDLIDEGFSDPELDRLMTERARGRDVYIGSVSDQEYDEYGAEVSLTNIGFDYKSDDINIYKEAGY